jgi:hypothetical protein
MAPLLQIPNVTGSCIQLLLIARPQLQLQMIKKSGRKFGSYRRCHVVIVDQAEQNRFWKSSHAFSCYQLTQYRRLSLKRHV